MPFKKMLRAFGVGGPSVNTELADPNTRPGGTVDGQVHLLGGDHASDIENVSLALTTRVEVETDDAEHDSTVEFHTIHVAGRFTLGEKETRVLPFRFPVPFETPITAMFGQHLHGMTMGLRTELAVAGAVDKGDLDPVNVHPLPAQEAVLDAFARIGFRFKRADLERGHIQGAGQTLPFYQEIEFYAPPQYAQRFTEAEVTMVTNQAGIDVILEIDKRGGLFTGGHDVFHRFQVPHAGFERVDWAAGIDGWLQQRVLGGGLWGR